MKKFTKIMFGIVLSFVVLFTGISNVYAKTLTINEVSTAINSSEMLEFFNSSSQDIFKTVVNTSESKLDVMMGDTKIGSLNYGADYIEYSNPTLNVENGVSNNELYMQIIAAEAMATIIRLAGHEDKDISNEADYTNTYDTYGLKVETVEGSYTDGNGDTISGSFVKYLKMSLDTAKVDLLIQEYGIDNPYGASAEVIYSLTPLLYFEDVTETSVKLFPKISYTNTDPNFKVYCDIYRSDTPNGTYVKITDERGIDCIHNGSYVDKGLKSNTTYYYKTIVQGGTIYSEYLEIQTHPAEGGEPTPTPAGDVKVPDTGLFFPTSAIVVLIGGFLLTYLYTRKHEF